MRLGVEHPLDVRLDALQTAPHLVPAARRCRSHLDVDVSRHAVAAAIRAAASRGRPRSPACPWPARTRRPRTLAGVTSTYQWNASPPAGRARCARPRCRASRRPPPRAGAGASRRRRRRPRDHVVGRGRRSGPASRWAMRTQSGELEAHGHHVASRRRDGDGPAVARAICVGDEIAAGGGEPRQRALDRGRHEVEREDLGVRVRDRRAGGPAVVDDRLHVRVPGVEVVRARSRSTVSTSTAWSSSSSAERPVVLGGEHDHLVRAGRAGRGVGRRRSGRGSGTRAPATRACRVRRGRCGAPRAASRPRGPGRTGSRPGTDGAVGARRGAGRAARPAATITSAPAERRRGGAPTLRSGYARHAGHRYRRV